MDREFLSQLNSISEWKSGLQSGVEEQDFSIALSEVEDGAVTISPDKGSFNMRLMAGEGIWISSSIIFHEAHEDKEICEWMNKSE